MAENGSQDDPKKLAQFIIERGLAEEAELRDTLSFLQQLSEDSNVTGEVPPTFDELLVTNQVLTPNQLRRVKAMLAKSGKQQIPGYQLLDRLGSGAMGTVYKARQISLDRIVAIKVLNHEFTRSRSFVERFYEEGRIAAKLNHPHIITAIDVGQAGEYHYFVMEYVEGQTVADMLEEDVYLDEEEAVRIVSQVAAGLEHAHAAGLIHRDVKPANIMIGSDGVAKLADMGLAQFAATDDMPHQDEDGKRRVFGTPYYMSPEHIRTKVPLDARTDIYSLGATFYHMITGHVPFDAPDPVKVMRRHLTDRFELPESVNPRVSSGASQVVQAAMKRRREKRYDSISPMLSDLKALLQMEDPLHAQSLLGMVK